MLTQACQTLPGLPRAARPSGRFAEGRNVRQTQATRAATLVSARLSDVARPSAFESWEGARGVQAREGFGQSNEFHSHCLSR